MWTIIYRMMIMSDNVKVHFQYAIYFSIYLIESHNWFFLHITHLKRHLSRDIWNWKVYIWVANSSPFLHFLIVVNI